MERGEKIQTLDKGKTDVNIKSKTLKLQQNVFNMNIYLKIHSLIQK